MGRANIYHFLKNKKFLVHSISQTAGGPSLADEPYLWLEENNSHDEMVRQLLRALNSSKKDLPIPKDWTAEDRKYLEDTGLKKMSVFYKDCRHVNATNKNGVIVFTPMINLGRKGFINVPNVKIEVLENMNSSVIVNALNTAFDKCE